MSRRYTAVDGAYLAINDRMQIGWHFPDEGEFGLMIANEPYRPMRNRESRLAQEAIHAVAERYDVVPLPHNPYRFDTITQAREALRAANKMLLTGERPIPDWARKALAAGWKAPRGWKP